MVRSLKALIAIAGGFLYMIGLLHVLLAATTIGGGIFTAGGTGASSTGPAIVMSSGKGVPTLPVSLGYTELIAIAKGGGMAITLDLRLAWDGTDAIGAGYGIGKMGYSALQNWHGGFTGMATVFYDHKIAPKATFEVRGYRPTGSYNLTGGFAGLKFTI
jgi:hypothetical protein